MSEVDTYSQEHLLNCYARVIIRDIRAEAGPEARERRFKYMLRKRSPDFREAMRERVRRLWKETNTNDGWEAKPKTHSKGKKQWQTSRRRR